VLIPVLRVYFINVSIITVYRINDWQGPSAHGPTYLPRSYCILNKQWLCAKEQTFLYVLISTEHCRAFVVIVGA
jgi:hypothetical protein